MRESLQALVRVIASTADQVNPDSNEVGTELLRLRRALRSAVARDHFVASPLHDYAAILDCALAGAKGQPLAGIGAALSAVRGVLPWTYHYESRRGEEDLASRIAFAELIGPDGPMDAPDARIGFTLLAPRTLYPMHAHPAVELYWVLSGHARWTSGHADATVPPGAFVLHRCNEPHAMQTTDEPLLALWGWSGDIDSPAAYI